FGVDPVTGAFTATANDFHYFVILGQNGDVGRNTFIGPGQMFYNTAIQRTFKFLERQSLTFRAEFFNAFNHPNLFTGGTASDTNSYSLTNPNFIDLPATINGNRQIKFWLKYAF